MSGEPITTYTMPWPDGALISGDWLDATRDEIAGQLPDWHPPTLSTALSRLLKGGAVARTGAARPSRRHQLQEVVQICDVGHAYGRSRDGEPSITPGGRRPRPVSSPTPTEWKDTA